MCVINNCNQCTRLQLVYTELGRQTQMATRKTFSYKVEHETSNRKTSVTELNI